MKKISYREKEQDSKIYKENYLKNIREIIAKREEEAESRRDAFCKDIFTQQEKCRKKYKAMLGWPLTEEKALSVSDAVVEKLAEDALCTIYRVSIKVLDGLSVTGLLFRKDDEKRPLVIAQHGGGGTPEDVGGLFGGTSNYNHIIERILHYNVNVFAPQLLLWWKDRYQVEYDRVAIDAQLKRVGSSITALEIYALSAILDYFETQPWVGNFGMVGLSYGGFYTLFMAAADTRIKSAISSCFFNERKRYAWSDWTWPGAAETFSDAEIACLVYPRRLCIEVGVKDEIFDIAGAQKERERLKQMCRDVGEDWLDFNVFEGGHEFCKDDEKLKKLIEDIS